jgi:hypothetical protein
VNVIDAFITFNDLNLYLYPVFFPKTSCTKYKEYSFAWGCENSFVSECDAYPTTSA